MSTSLLSLSPVSKDADILSGAHLLVPSCRYIPECFALHSRQWFLFSASPTSFPTVIWSLNIRFSIEISVYYKKFPGLYIYSLHVYLIMPAAYLIIGRMYIFMAWMMFFTLNWLFRTFFWWHLDVAVFLALFILFAVWLWDNKVFTASLYTCYIS